MKMIAVNACTKAGVGISPGHKKTCFHAIFLQNCLEKKTLTVQSDLHKLIDIERTELCFLNI